MADAAGPSLAYFWGEDSYAIGHAADLFAAELAAQGGQPMDVWRTSGDDDDGGEGAATGGGGKRRDRILGEIEQRLATAPMFSGGTLVVVRQPGSLIRESSAREQTVSLLDAVAPGNALCFVDLVASGGRGPAQAGALRDAVVQRNGRVADFPRRGDARGTKRATKRDTKRGSRLMADATAPSLAYFWGEDAYAIGHAAELFAAELAAQGGQPMDVWRTSGDEDDGAESAANGGSGKRRARILDEIEQRLATAPMFSGGTLVVVRQPGSLIRESSAREQTVSLLDSVAPGNALCFVDLVASGGRGPAQAGALRDAVAERHGRVADFPAPSRERMEGWIGTRAKELGVALGPGAAHLLAERVGAYVREGDVDRRRQTELANAELEKLALCIGRMGP